MSAPTVPQQLRTPPRSIDRLQRRDARRVALVTATGVGAGGGIAFGLFATLFVELFGPAFAAGKSAHRTVKVASHTAEQIIGVQIPGITDHLNKAGLIPSTGLSILVAAWVFVVTASLLGGSIGLVVAPVATRMVRSGYPVGWAIASQWAGAVVGTVVGATLLLLSQRLGMPVAISMGAALGAVAAWWIVTTRLLRRRVRMPVASAPPTWADMRNAA